MSSKVDFNSDLLIIGGGPGGYVAAIYAAKNGLDVTLVEAGKLGGTCLNVGCIPTKALVKSSEVCKSVSKANEFGIVVDGYEVDMKTIIKRKDKTVEGLVSGIEFLMKKNKINLISGHASFLSNREISVKGEKETVIAFKNVIIATGSKVSNIDIPGMELPCVMNSTEALDCTELPKSIIIVGGGVVGMEFAFIYRNLGIEVHVIEYMDRLLTMLDKDVSREILKSCRKAGIKVSTKAKVTEIGQSNDGQAIVTYEDRKGIQTSISDKVLVATGRKPNLDDLGIENTYIGLNNNGRGIFVDERMSTNQENVYAIGDVTDIFQLAHVASYQGMIAVDNILGKEKKADYTAVPNVIFTYPEIATVGLSEEECKDKNMDYSISKSNYMSNGKAMTMGQPEGFVKLIKDNRTHKIVGCSIIGADASSLISGIGLAISNELKVKDLREVIFPHPTTSEVIYDALEGLVW